MLIGMSFNVWGGGEVSHTKLSFQIIFFGQKTDASVSLEIRVSIGPLFALDVVSRNYTLFEL